MRCSGVRLERGLLCTARGSGEGELENNDDDHQVDKLVVLFFFQAEDGIRDVAVTGVQTCALPISNISEAVVSWTSPRAIATCPATSSTSARPLFAGSAFPARRSAATAAAESPRASRDRKSTRLNSSHGYISYAVFCLKKKKKRNLTSKRGEVGYRMLTRAQLMDRQTHAIDSDAQLDAVQSDTYYLIVALGSLSPACSQQSCQSL